RHEQLAALEDKELTHLPSSEFLGNPVVNSLRSEWVRAKGSHEELVRSGRGERHPSVLASQARVDELTAALTAEISNIRAALQADLAAKAREEAGLKQLHDRAKTRALDLNALSLAYHRWERAKNNTEKLYSVVLERTKESDVTRFMRFNNISVLDEAVAGKTPILPRTPLNVAFGLVVGLAARFLMTLARNHFDRTLQNPAAVEKT